MTPRVSVVITAHDAAKSVARCVRAVAAQRGWGEGELEIVLVDDRSTDGTLDVARALELLPLRAVRIDRYTARAMTARQAALDLGFRESRAPIILVTDADAEPPPDWAARLAAPIERREADVVAGGVEFVPADGGARAIAALQTADAAYYLAVCQLLDTLGTESGLLFGSVAFRREVYDSLGGFAAIGLALTEDLAFARGAKRRGFRRASVPRPLVAVQACRSLREVVRRACRTSAGGWSVLAGVLGVWALTLPLLAVAAALGLAPAWWLLARYLTGVAFVGAAVARGGRPRLIPWALVYEPLSIIAGASVLWALRGATTIEWGGVEYPRTPTRGGTRAA